MLLFYLVVLIVSAVASIH